MKALDGDSRILWLEQVATWRSGLEYTSGILELEAAIVWDWGYWSLSWSLHGSWAWRYASDILDIGLATMWRELGLERLRNTGAGPGRYIGGVPGGPLRDAGA